MGFRANGKSTIVAAVAAAVAVAGVGVGVAYADPTPPVSPTPSASPTAGGEEKKAERKKQRRLERRALHGEATLAGRNHKVIAFQRGQVTKVDSSSVTVASADGFTATYRTSAETKVRKARNDAELSEVTTTVRVRVVAEKVDDTLTARRIVVVAR